MKKPRFFICQSPLEIEINELYWRQYDSFNIDSENDILVLNEMPFDSWHFDKKEVTQDVLLNSEKKHLDCIAKLQSTCPFLGLLSSSPVLEQDKKVINQSFFWSKTQNIQWGHSKQYFPEEDGFYEALFFTAGNKKFELLTFKDLKIGTMLCTDAMFTQWARYYSKLGANIIAIPRATTKDVDSRWESVIRTIAITSGCYIFSSNRYGKHSESLSFGGEAFAFNPRGKLLGKTSEKRPILHFDIDINQSKQAKKQYPVYVKD